MFRKPAGRTVIWSLCTKTTSSPSMHRIWDCSSSPTSSKFICAVGLSAVSDAKAGLYWKCWLFSQAFLALWSTCCNLNDENLNPTVCFDLWLKPNIHVLRAANHYILAIVRYAQGHCTMLLCSWSYHYAVPQKNKRCLFLIPCVRVGIKFISNWLRICLFCVWGVGCATANQHSHFNQLTSRSIQFNSRSYASLPGERTSIFNHFKSLCRSENLKASSLVMNLIKIFRSLWYNRNDWLGIKHQVTYLLAYFLLIVIYVCCDHITCCVFPGAQILVSWGRWTPWGRCLHALWGSHMFFILLSIMLGIFNVSKAHPKLDYISFIS